MTKIWLNRYEGFLNQYYLTKLSKVVKELFKSLWSTIIILLKNQLHLSQVHTLTLTGYLTEIF
jgi:hypothetical protein